MSSGVFHLRGNVLFVEGEGGILRLRCAPLPGLPVLVFFKGGLGRQDAFPWKFLPGLGVSGGTGAGVKGPPPLPPEMGCTHVLLRLAPPPDAV